MINTFYERMDLLLYIKYLSDYISVTVDDWTSL